MLTIEALQKDMIAAMKEHNTVKKEALSSAVALIKKTAIDNKCKDNISEQMIVDCLRKEIKTLQEQLDTCPADRVELLEEFRYKKDILNQYVPQLVSDYDEISRLVTSILKDITIVDKGQVMKLVMPQLKGKVDMKVANKVISDLFGGK